MGFPENDRTNRPCLGVRGIGNDILEINRIRKTIEKHGNHFYEKIFTETEIEYCLSYKDPASHLAGRFSAKEAIAKALGCGIGEKMSWQDVETYRSGLGKPEVNFSGAALEQLNRLGGKSCHLSLSDEHSVALAFAVIET